MAIRRSFTYGGGKTVDAMGGKGSKAASETPAPELPKELDEKLTLMFEKMDDDKNGTVDRAEAIKFWGKNFAKVNANRNVQRG